MMTQQHNPALRFGIHFVPLFVVAAIAWMALQLVAWGGAHIAPGLIVAALLAAGGTRIALRDGTREAQRETRGAPFTAFTSSPRTGTIAED